MLAWHFVKIAHFAPVLRDGITIVRDVTTYDGPMVMCSCGLHASVRAIDALSYAPGPIACRVECSGDIEQSHDKLICRRRRVLWMVYAVRPLKLWACDCAERALLREREAGREPDPRSWRGIEVQRSYLDGRATIEELREAGRASYAARDDASSAASSAAWAAEKDWQESALVARLTEVGEGQAGKGVDRG